MRSFLSCEKKMPKSRLMVRKRRTSHISIGEAATSFSKRLTETNSYVSIQLDDNKMIFMASGKYKKGLKSTDGFYKEHQISANINLLDKKKYGLDNHGGADDNFRNTLPNFYQAAKDLRAELALPGSRVLVNCHHGRSRTGSVVALYLILYMDLTADDAISLVNSALSERGITKGIDIPNAINGSYGQWLRDMERGFKDQNNITSYEDYIEIMHLTPETKRYIENNIRTLGDEELEELINHPIKELRS